MKQETKAWLKRETAVSIVINTALSAGFFFLAFGGQDPVQLWGAGQWIFDFLPQSFMIALMSSLVPGALARRARKDGKLAYDPGAGGAMIARLPDRLITHALVMAVVAAALGTALMAAVFLAIGLDALPKMSALLLKMAYGAIEAIIVTPIGLRRIISRDR